MTLEVLSSRLIRVFEGIKLKAYQDSGGIWTIGWGHTLGVTKGMIITVAQAEAFFAEDSSSLLQLVRSRPILEGAAFVSFGYNCGIPALKRVLSGVSNLTEFIRDRKGTIQPGLVARRMLESALIEVSRNQ